MKQWLVIILSAVLVSHVWCGCTFYTPDFSLNDNGDYEVYCPHPDFLLTVGQWQVADNCEVCSCSDENFSCCRVLNQRAFMTYSNGCRRIPDASNRCGFRLVGCN